MLSTVALLGALSLALGVEQPVYYSAMSDQPKTQKDVWTIADQIIAEAGKHGLRLRLDGSRFFDHGAYMEVWLAGSCRTEADYDRIVAEILEDFIEGLGVVPQPGQLKHDDDGVFAPHLGFRLRFQARISDGPEPSPRRRPG